MCPAVIKINKANKKAVKSLLKLVTLSHCHFFFLQDLPNNMIHQVPIKSLPQEWLWCETWCDDSTKKSAKTIDLVITVCLYIAEIRTKQHIRFVSSL